MSASCRLTMFLSFGLTAWIGMQALTNMLVALSLLPTKGLTLPLVSFGRSSLIVTMLAIGILLRISAEERSHVPARKSKGTAKRKAKRKKSA